MAEPPERPVPARRDISTIGGMAGEDRSVRAAPLVAVAFVCVIAIAGAIALLAPTIAFPVDQLFGDFRVTIWEPGQELLSGHDPMRAVDDEYNGGIYPPAAIVATLPISALPYHVAVVVWLVALLVGVAGALYLCAVRDWRCYAAAFASPPVVAGLAYGNVSLLVLLGIAGVWVMRDRPWRSGLLLGFVIATRLFPWPVVVWLLFTRRIRAAAVAAASSMVFSFMGWLGVSFHRIGEFPAVTRSNAAEFVDQGVSVASIVANLGGSSKLIGFALVIVLALTLAVAARCRHDDLACFSWAITAALFSSPIVWGHYFALLLVPIAVASPRLSRAWLLPYLTAPQLTGTFEAGQKIVDAASGVLFACLTSWHVRGRVATPAEKPLGFTRTSKPAPASLARTS